MADNRLAVIWSSADPEVAHNVCFMYTHNAKRRGWFDDVTLVVWGPSARLLTERPDLQERLQAMQEDGVTIQACKACADQYGVAPALEGLGIEVIFMGQPLTAMLKEGWKTLTF